MKKYFEHPLVLFLLRIFLGLIFIYASWDKILHPAQFAKAVYNYKILPVQVINLFALILPWIELISGIGLILGIFTQGCALIITSLLCIFVIVAAISIYRNLDILCGCFDTAGGRKVGVKLLLEDSSLMLLGLWVLMREKGKWGLDGLKKGFKGSRGQGFKGSNKWEINN
jgi:uncharacterized membrane protein YphA (DoxX/SURF4 family)